MSNSKTFVTSDGAKHTRFSSDDEDDAKQKDKPEKKVEKIQVQSANSWEKADLGDGERNNKFLRLMGAAKKTHQGRFVIGDNSPHAKSGGNSGKLNDKLEEQYKHSMEHRLFAGPKGHVGLGFSDADSTNEDSKEKTRDSGTESSDRKDTSSTTERGDENKKSEDLKRPPAEEEASESKGDKSDAKKMKFVKSSTDD